MTEGERKQRDTAILFGHISGDNTKTLMEKHDLSQTCISKILRSQGVRKKKEIERKYEHVIDLFEKGKSRKEIAEEIGETYDVIRWIIRNSNHAWLSKEANCTICGKRFSQQSENHHICSDECRFESRREKNKGSYKRDIGTWRKCEFCGKRYKVRGQCKYYQRFCSRSCGGKQRYRNKVVRDQLILEYREVDNLTFRRIAEIFNISKSSTFVAYKKQKQIRDEQLANIGVGV